MRRHKPQRVYSAAVHAQLQVQMIPAARAVDVAGVAHIPEQVALLHGGPLRHGDAAHVGE